MIQPQLSQPASMPPAAKHLPRRLISPRRSQASTWRPAPGMANSLACSAGEAWPKAQAATIQKMTVGSTGRKAPISPVMKAACPSARRA